MAAGGQKAEGIMEIEPPSEWMEQLCKFPSKGGESKRLPLEGKAFGWRLLPAISPHHRRAIDNRPRASGFYWVLAKYLVQKALDKGDKNDHRARRADH